MHTRPCVLHIIPSLAQGGAERVLCDVAANVTSVRHVIVTLEDAPEFYPVPAGVKVYRIGIPQQNRRSIYGRILAALKFPFIIAREKPATVVGWSYVGQVAAASLRRYFGIKAVWSMHCPIDDAVLDDADNKPRCATYARLSAWADAVHYPTERTREQMERRGLRRAAGHVVRHTIDMTRFCGKESVHA